MRKTSWKSCSRFLVLSCVSRETGICTWPLCWKYTQICSKCYDTFFSSVKMKITHARCFSKQKDLLSFYVRNNWRCSHFDTIFLHPPLVKPKLSLQLSVYNSTGRCCGNTPNSFPGFSSSTFQSGKSYLDWHCCDIYQSVRDNFRVMLRNWALQPPSKSLPIHHLLSISHTMYILQLKCRC